MMRRFLQSFAADHRNRWGVAALLALLLWVALFAVNIPSLKDAAGHWSAGDFISGWSAAHSLKNGVPAATLYDWQAHHAEQEKNIGYAVAEAYGWQYPPFAFFIVLPLAYLSYAVGWLVWSLLTAGFYAAAMRGILRHWAAVPLALSFPASGWNALVGQNGFLTAGLMGFAVLFLDKRPVLAGIFLGLLAFKPQFGLLFPLVLLLERRWRTIGAAAFTLGLLIVASLAVFGWAAWAAFIEWLPYVAERILVKGEGGHNRLHSVAGWAMMAGWKDVAFFLQAGVAALVVAGVVYLRRQPVDGDLKNAALSLGVVFLTPYIWVYDLVLLTVPLAFLLRMAWRTGFLPGEGVMMLTVAALVMLFPATVLPTGLPAALVVVAMILYRWRAARETVT